MNYGASFKSMSSTPLTRRDFLRVATATCIAISLPKTTAAAMKDLKKEIRIGMIADLHHDLIHDGIIRLRAFVNEMAIQRPDMILQLGDFAYPNARNKDVIDLFNQSQKHSLHVIGNHDMDDGHTRVQCLDIWGMTGRYYMQNIAGLWLLILDGNDSGSPAHKGGYPSYIGKEQVNWLKKQLADVEGPVIVVSHQPLAGAFAVDNADEIQRILGESSEKVLLALNGHSHIDDVLRVRDVTYMHVNSASYQWVGGAYQHESYSKEVHDKYPWVSHTCPYRESLFASLTVDPESLTILIEGRQSEWVGLSPAELGVDLEPTLINGEEVAPRIRYRTIERIVK